MMMMYETWNTDDGGDARAPVLRTHDRKAARTTALIQVGAMCQSGEWRYSTIMVTGSSVLNDVFELEHVDNPQRKFRAEVRPIREGEDQG